jgi:hypothetical protein
MKKIVTLFCFVASMLPMSIGTAYAQNSNFRRDSLYQILKLAQTPASQVDVWANIYEDLVTQVSQTVYCMPPGKCLQ